MSPLRFLSTMTLPPEAPGVSLDCLVDVDLVENLRQIFRTGVSHLVIEQTAGRTGLTRLVQVYGPGLDMLQDVLVPRKHDHGVGLSDGQDHYGACSRVPTGAISLCPQHVDELCGQRFRIQYGGVMRTLYRPRIFGLSNSSMALIACLMILAGPWRTRALRSMSSVTRRSMP